MGSFTNVLNEGYKSQPGYQRKLLQTYFTAPEWRNVEMAEEMAAFLKAGNPFYRYPYFQQIYQFWRVFAKSYSAARKHHSLKDMWFSDYMFMNIFIGVFTTLGCFFKGIFSLILYPFMRKKNDTSTQQHIAELVNNYATFIHKIPFFNYSYVSKIKPLWKAFFQSQKRTVADFFSVLLVTGELLGSALTSMPIAWFYNQPQNQAAEVIHVVVKTTKSDGELRLIDERIQLIGETKHKTSKKSGTEYHYVHLTIPRYEAFQEITEKLVAAGILIRKIAGQDHVQFKLHVEKAADLADTTSTHYAVLYRYQNYVDAGRFVVIDVPTKELNATVTELNAKPNVTLRLIHDF